MAFRLLRVLGSGVRRQFAAALRRGADFLAPPADGGEDLSSDLDRWRRRFPGAPDDWLRRVSAHAPRALDSSAFAARAAPRVAISQPQSLRARSTDTPATAPAASSSASGGVLTPGAGPAPVPALRQPRRRPVVRFRSEKPAEAPTPAPPRRYEANERVHAVTARVPSEIRGAHDASGGPDKNGGAAWGDGRQPSQRGALAGAPAQDVAPRAARALAEAAAGPKWLPPNFANERAAETRPVPQVAARAAADALAVGDRRGGEPRAGEHTGRANERPTAAAAPPRRFTARPAATSRDGFASEAARRVVSAEEAHGFPDWATSSTATATADPEDPWPSLPPAVPAELDQRDSVASRITELIAAQEGRGWSESRS